jgi:predicted permease
MAALIHDVRYALRQMRLAPVFTITVMLTLGLGIGATTAIFSLIHTVMLKSLPVADPSALYRIGTGKVCCYIDTPQGEWGLFSYDFYHRIQKSAPQFQQIAAFQAEPHILSIRRSGSADSQARAFLGEYVSGNYFQTFGVKPFAGRLFTPADDRRNATPVAVLSYRTWQQDFGGNPSVVGSTFIFERFPFLIVGVAPPGFFGETLSSTPPSIWIPLQVEYLLDADASFNAVPSSAWLRLIGRLHPGASTAGVPSQLTSLLRHWLVADAAMTPDHRAELLENLSRQRIDIASAAGGVGAMKDAYGASLRILLGACLLVLLIACSNIANLLLARGISRRANSAVHVALGASRRRLVRQAFTESVLLGMLGAIVGVAIAWAGARIAVLLAFGHAHAFALDIHPSWPVLGFCFAVALLCAIVFGIVPAWLSMRTNPIEAVRGANRATGRSSSRLRKSLIVLQSAVSLVLIAGATMLTHGLLNVEGQNFGFSTSNRIVVRMEEPLAAYSLDHLNVLYRQLRLRLEQLPGVRSASVALYGPLITGQWKQFIVKPGQGLPRVDGSQTAMWDRVSPGYFQTIGQRIVQGREFTDADDTATQGVAVVNEAFVRRFFPREDTLGQYFGFGKPEYSKTFRIVGVARDAKYANPNEPAAPMVFGAIRQRVVYTQPVMRDNEKWSHFITGVQVWADGDLGEMEPRIRQAFKEIDPNFAIVGIQTMQQQVASNFDQERAVAQLSGLFGILALLLTAIGLYGVTAYTVERRTGEIGVRMALGANRADILILILRGAFTQVALGLAIGIPAAVFIGKLHNSRLYKVGAIDPIALVTAVSALLFAAFAASVIPAWRAASTEPLEALRTE